MELIQQPSRNPAECNHQNGIDLVFPGADEGYQEDEDTDEELVLVRLVASEVFGGNQDKGSGS